jgi:hypothetical protein
MLRPLIATPLLVLAAAAAFAQGGQGPDFDFEVDSFFRDEWTREIFPPPGQAEFTNTERWRFQLRPRVTLNAGGFLAGVGGELNTSDAENVGEIRPLLIRDNYDAEDVRLDLAYAGLEAGGFRLQAGRFFMPVGFTEMIWDRDLRPQGGAASVALKAFSGIDTLSGTVLYAQGSHVFEDEEVRMYAASGNLVFATGTSSKLDLTASYVRFDRLNGEKGLEPMIRRQNSRLTGVPPPLPLALEYEIVDGVARLRSEGAVHTQIVVNYCWNSKADQDNTGLWLALVLGSLKTSLGRLEYTYAKVDKDATVAAYATDDFFWATGWEGHRGDLGFKTTEQSSIHAIGQLQRFKDSPVEADRDKWVKRYRLELRIAY